MTSWRIDIYVLIIVSILLFGIFLGNRPLTVPDEGRYAEIPREMLTTHDFVTPHLNGIKYFEKPPLFYWMQAISLKIGGINLWSIRLVNALMGLMTCLLTYWAGRTLYDRKTGFFSAVILATSALFVGMSRFVTIDMTLTAMLTGCLFCFLLATQSKDKKQFSRLLVCAYAFAGLATMTKGLVGFLLPGAIMMLWFLICQQWHRLREFLSLPGFLIFLGITVPWHIMAQIHNPEFARYYFLDQQFLRYFTDTSDRDKPLWFLPAIAIMGVFPWCCWIIPAIKEQFSKLQHPQLAPPIAFLLIWAISIFLFFWVSHSQLAPYVLPIFPAIAVIIGHYFATKVDQKPTLGLTLGFICATVLSNTAAFFLILKFPTQDSVLYACGGLLAGSFQALVFIFRKSVKKAFITLCVLMGYFIINLAYHIPTADDRSIKPLADILKPRITPSTIVANYQHYYQDLPVYLQQNVLLVDWYGELKHGLSHQSTEGLWTDENHLWELWKKPNPMYMILSIGDYERLKETTSKPLIEISRTSRDILVTNQDT